MSINTAKPLYFWGAVCFPVVAFFVVALWPSKQPSYSGHALDAWFKRLPWVNPVPNALYVPGQVYPKTSAAVADCRAALAAIQGMGTNAAPFLIARLGGRRAVSPMLERLLYRYAGNWPVVRKYFGPAARMKEEGQALAGLLALCPLPPDLEQRLRLLSLEFNRAAYDGARYVLKANNDPEFRRHALDTSLRLVSTGAVPTGFPSASFWLTQGKRERIPTEPQFGESLSNHATLTLGR